MEESEQSTVKFNQSPDKYDNYLNQKQLEDTINDMQSVSTIIYQKSLKLLYACQKYLVLIYIVLTRDL